MPHVKNLNFPEYMFALLFLHATGDNFGKQKQHKMKELSILREWMKLVSKKSVSAPSHIMSIICILHWFLWNPKIFDNFQSKSHLNNSAVVL